MTDCFQMIFFCFDWSSPNRQQTTRRPTRIRTPKKTKQPLPLSRMITKYGPKQLKLITDEQRKAGVKPAYPCPICFQYFNKILACEQCTNYICHSCCQKYQRRSQRTKQGMTCAFCFSKTAKFIDCQLEPHSYFDTTNKGNKFLSLQERKQIDREIQEQAAKKLEEIREQIEGEITHRNRQENENIQINNVQLSLYEINTQRSHGQNQDNRNQEIHQQSQARLAQSNRQEQPAN